ncbi:MAG: YtxH domain-containing protein [Actinomycetia bacterium]|nr:YtxH domain-containing protein [Actinomycetes bacterium]
MYDNRRGESILGAFLFGGMLGAVLGLLFAPRPGKENRDLIAEKAKEYWGESKDVYESGREKVSEVYGTGKDKATETAEELRAKIDSARDRLREQVETVSGQAKDKVVEYAPAAKETVHKVGEAVKTGVETAEVKAEDLLDKVAERTGTKESEPRVDLPE